MTVNEYDRAKKLGEKAYRAAASRKEFPYLPALDDFLKTADVLDEVEVGLVDVPLEQIVGTKTVGRQTAFAPNFMPLMKEKSEFAMKWMSLFEYQMDEGIKDPIIAYEYMNRYYVLEGNKRVSVLKYLGAFSIEANVIRVVPRRSEDPQVQVFYEYMSFNRYSQLSSIWFTKPGGYSALLKVLGIPADREWTEEERKDVSSEYFRFAKLFEEKGGKKLDITPGDAFLTYLSVFPYAEMSSKSEAQLKDELTKIWSEFSVIRATPDQTLVLDPEKEPEDGVFSRFLGIIGAKDSKYLKVAFVHEYPPYRSGWTYSHELGRMHLDHVFQGKISTSYYTLDEHTADRYAAIEAAVEDGNHIIFTTNETLLEASLKAAVKYPKVKILNCCVHRPHKLLRTYYGRMYEAKFLEGMIAGAMSENDRIAYTASYPIYGALANANAFALGARMTNPRAKIYLHWYSQEGADLDELLRREDIHIVSDVDVMRPRAGNRRYGLYRLDGDSFQNLAMPMWNWGKFYEKILNDILSGSWESQNVKERPAVNYWWGISGDIIDLLLSRSMPSGLVTLVNMMKDQIYKGAFHPFAGPITRQDGKIIGEEYKILSSEEIITMNWLCDNIIGSIPETDMLNERARQIMESVGIEAAKGDITGEMK